jgi:hypothetical protein
MDGTLWRLSCAPSALGGFLDGFLGLRFAPPQAINISPLRGCVWLRVYLKSRKAQKAQNERGIGGRQKGICGWNVAAAFLRAFSARRFFGWFPRAPLRSTLGYKYFAATRLSWLRGLTRQRSGFLFASIRVDSRLNLSSCPFAVVFISCGRVGL